MSIYQHYRPEEKDFIDKVLQWKSNVERTHVPKLTDFLDPREVQIVKQILGDHGDVKADYFGGTHLAERKRAIIMPDYQSANPEDFQIALRQVEYNHKFVAIEHPQVLGTLMSIGLTRGKFGDILVKDKQIQFFVCNDVSDFVALQVTSIGKAPVTFATCRLLDAIELTENWTEDELTLSSLRLDSAVGAILHLHGKRRRC